MHFVERTDHCSCLWKAHASFLFKTKTFILQPTPAPTAFHGEANLTTQVLLCKTLTKALRESQSLPLPTPHTCRLTSFSPDAALFNPSENSRILVRYSVLGLIYELFLVWPGAGHIPQFIICHQEWWPISRGEARQFFLHASGKQTAWLSVICRKWPKSTLTSQPTPISLWFFPFMLFIFLRKGPTWWITPPPITSEQTAQDP